MYVLLTQESVYGYQIRQGFILCNLLSRYNNAQHKSKNAIKQFKQILHTLTNSWQCIFKIKNIPIAIPYIVEKMAF